MMYLTERGLPVRLSSRDLLKMSTCCSVPSHSSLRAAFLFLFFVIPFGTARVSAQSAMPWGGKSDIHVSAKDDVKGTIKLRIPGWARNQPVPSGLYSYMTKIDRLLQRWRFSKAARSTFQML